MIDLGPEGGDGGGCVVARGTPEAVARCGGFPHRTLSQGSPAAEVKARPFVLRAAPILIRLALAAFALEAQENGPAEEAGQQSEAGPAEGRSLSDDIGNSRQEELIAWNRILGLSELGSRGGSALASKGLLRHLRGPRRGRPFN